MSCWGRWQSGRYSEGVPTHSPKGPGLLTADSKTDLIYLSHTCSLKSLQGPSLLGENGLLGSTHAEFQLSGKWLTCSVDIAGLGAELRS